MKQYTKRSFKGITVWIPNFPVSRAQDRVTRGTVIFKGALGKEALRITNGEIVVGEL